MDVPDSTLVLPTECFHIPLRAINMATRRKLSNFLNLEGSLVVVKVDGEEFDVVNDITGLAELARFTYQEILSMKNQRDATTEFLNQWTSRNATVGMLWQLLFLIERFDVLTDCRHNIIRDCNRYEDQLDIEMHANMLNIEQDPTVSTSEMNVDETKIATRHDAISGDFKQQIQYDAFLSYSPDDIKDRDFVREMIDILETKRGLKLFVPGRDDLPGAAEYTITAYLIEKRCKRVAILISKSFLRSAACDFQVKFAHALAPGARSKRLIPIIREKNTPLPRILKFLAVCDFSKSDMTDWVWDRLYAAMLAPVGPITFFEDDDTGDMKGIPYPTPPRLSAREPIENSMSTETMLQPEQISESLPVEQSVQSSARPQASQASSLSLSSSSKKAKKQSKPSKSSGISSFFKRPHGGSKKPEEHFV